MYKNPLGRRVIHASHFIENKVRPFRYKCRRNTESAKREQLVSLVRYPEIMELSINNFLHIRKTVGALIENSLAARLDVYIRHDMWAYRSAKAKLLTNQR